MENKGNLIENLQANQWLDRNRLQYNAQAVRNSGDAVGTFVGHRFNKRTIILTTKDFTV
jgi:hypothetical protein